MARTEGVLLAPVYTGKATAGLIGLARQGRFPSNHNVLFQHTGGVPALYAYAPVYYERAGRILGANRRGGRSLRG